MEKQQEDTLEGSLSLPEICEIADEQQMVAAMDCELLSNGRDLPAFIEKEDFGKIDALFPLELLDINELQPDSLLEFFWDDRIISLQDEIQSRFIMVD